MRVGLLTQWFDPEPGPAALPGVLARGLLARGHSVQILTGFPNYPTGKLHPDYPMSRSLDEIVDGMSVRRVALYPSHDGSTTRRMINYASFGASAVMSGLGALRGVDALWVNYSPITIAWPAWAAKIGLGIPWVAHVLDLWPDTILASGMMDRGTGYAATRTLLNAWCGGMYRSASAVAYISPGVREVLERRGVPSAKLSYVPMWADENIFRPSSADMRATLAIPREAVVLLYAGSLGEAQGLSTLIDACQRVPDPRFVCLIAGSGGDEAALRERAAMTPANRVRFIGCVSQQDMTALMATADFNYIGLREHPLSAITMPSKTQAALASGRAILVASRGDVAQVARDSGAGWAVDPDDVTAIAAAIQSACDLGRGGLRQLGARGRKYYDRTFSVAHGVERVESLLQDAKNSKEWKSMASSIR